MAGALGTSRSAKSSMRCSWQISRQTAHSLHIQNRQIAQYAGALRVFQAAHLLTEESGQLHQPQRRVCSLPMWGAGLVGG